MNEIKPLKVRQGQEGFQQSLPRLTNFSYEAKIAEIKLKRLMATL
jgi:hypothetical protein